MRSAKDSDDDVEEKAGAGRLRTQLHTIQSPLRRSTRLKQNKYSPGSESDSSSVSNSRNRTRTATIDSTVSDTIMKLRTRKPSVSSDISEISEIDVGSPPKKRITRQSLNAPATPTRVNTRAASKRLIRAVSEAYSPSPVTRSRRSSRASSVDPEFSVDKSKGRPETPVKTRKRATVLPSSSLVKEQLELKDRIPYVRLDATIIEADEITNSGNSDSSSKKELHLPKNQTKKRQSIDNEVEADESHGNSDSSPGKTLHLPKSLQTKKRQSIDKDEAETDDCHENWGSSPDKTLHLPKSPQIQKRQSIDKEEAEADDSHGNSDSSPGKTLHLPKSPQIKKRQSINKDEAEADNSHENSNSSPEIFTLLWRKSPQIKNRQSIDKDEADDSYENSGSSPDKTLHLPKSPQIQKRQSIDKDEADDNHGNLDSSQKEIIALHLLESQKIKKRQSVDKDEVEDDSDEDDEKLKTLTDSSKDEAFQLVEREDWIQAEDVDSATVKNTDNILAEEEDKLGKCPSFNNSIIEISSSCSSSPQSFAKEDQTKIAEENPSNVEKSIVNVHKLEVAENEFEKLVDTSSEEQKSDKENEMLNINSDVSIEKNRLPILISSVSCGMSALPFMNESLNEKETKLLKRAELLSRRRRSRESIEMKYDNLSKKVADDSQEKMDISTEFLTSTTNVTVLSQHDMYSPKLVEKVINKDETSNENISKSTTEMSSESVKINEKEYTVIDNKNSHKIESDKMSRSSINLVESTQIENKDNNGQSCTFIPTTDDNNEIRLEEQNSHQDENEVPSPCKFDQSKDMRISSPANKNSDDQIIIQDKITESSDSIKEKQEQQDLSKCTKLALEFSNTTLELNNSVRNDSNNIVIQDDQSSDVTETSKKSGLDLSPEKTDAKDILPEKIVKRNLKRNSTDVLNGREREKEHSQMELCQKYVVNNIEISNDSDDSDVEGLKSLFQNVPVHGNKSPLKNAEDIKAARNLDEGYDFEPTSDDERLVKSRLDVVDEELMDIDNEEIENRFKGEKAKIYRRITTLDEESLERIEDEDNSKAVNELKTSLNDRKSFGLNKSGQLTRTSERSFKTINESDKEIEDDTTKLNRSLLINKKNTSLRSLGERTSTNNFSRDTSMQNASINKSRIDDSEEELDNTDVHAGKKLYKKKRSLNKSRKEDADDDTIESEKTVSTKDSSQTNKNTLRKYLNRSIDQKSKPVDTKMTLDLYADKSDSDKSAVTTNLGSKTSMIANVGSHMSDEDSNDESNCCDRSYKFAKAISDIDSSSDAADNRNNSNDNSSDSDIIREYNLNGVDPKYEDDFDIYGQLCRASETESSDSSDNGSDLADFIVDDVEDEEEKEEDMEDKESSEQDVEINFETIHKDKAEDENKFAETKADISDKIHKDRNKYLSYKSDTEMKRNKMTCSMEKNAETILDSSNSELSSKKKKKSLTKENDNILLDASNSISSLSKKKRKSYPQYSSRDEAERDSNELNKSESLSAKKPKSYESMKFSTPIYSSMTLELDEIFKRISKDKDIKRDNAIETIQNTSTKKKSSINPTNEDISSNNAISSNELSPDLLKLLEKTSFLKSTSSKMRSSLRKTMSIVDSETPTLKHLRKEKLNDSAPILKLNTETISTKKLSVGKDTVQIKEKNNDKVSELIMLSNDDAIQRYSEKKQKKRKKGDRSKEDIIDETLSEDLNVSKKKNNKDKVPELIMLSNDDAIQRYSEKKQKKRKKGDRSKEDIIDEALSEDLNVPKKKNNKDKVPELIMLSNDDAIQRYSEKKQKKRKKGDRSKEDIIDEALSEDLNVPKKKNNKDKVPELIMLSNDDAIQRYSEKKQKKRKKGDRSKEDIIDEVLSEDLNVPKKIKRIKLTHLSTRDDNLCEDPYQIEEKKKKKKKKQDTLREYIVDKALFENATELKIPKKKKLVKPTQLIIDDNIWEDVCQINEKPKKKKQDTLREYIADKTLFEDATELKIPKKKKSVKLTKLTNDNIGKDASISTKKKKMQDSTKESIIDEALPHDAVVLKIPKIEKRAKLDKLAITKTNICKSAYETKKEKKKKKEIKKNIIEKTLSEDTTELKMPKMKKRAKLDKLAITEDNIYKSAYQVEKEKKEKKGKTKENISEKALSEDAIELKISKKKKHANIDKLATVQNNAHENAYQINEKKKKKKKQINVTEEDENVNEDNILRKKTRENKTGLEQKKKKKIVNSLKLSSPTDKHVTKKKIKQQETVKSIETLWMEKKDTLPVQIPVSKLIKTSDKNLSHKRIQKPILDENESKYIVCTSKKPDKAIAKMYVSEELRIPKELKLKKKRIGMEDIENTKKSKKEVKEVTKSLPSSRGLKRLPDYVIENLSDVPTRQKKKRKISRNEDKVLPIKMNKSKAMTKDYDDSFTLSTSGSTNTQFHLVNLQNTKKQPLHGTAAAISFRQRMLAKNERKPISIYSTYRKKMNLE